MKFYEISFVYVDWNKHTFERESHRFTDKNKAEVKYEELFDFITMDNLGGKIVDNSYHTHLHMEKDGTESILTMEEVEIN